MIKDPDVAGPPVIKGIAGIAESLRRGGRPRLIFLKAQFGLRGKRHVAMQRLVGADADKRSKTSTRGQPVGKGRNKRFKGHFRLIKRKKTGIGDGILGRLPDPFNPVPPGDPFRLMLRYAAHRRHRQRHPIEAAHHILIALFHILHVLDG